MRFSTKPRTTEDIDAADLEQAVRALKGSGAKNNVRSLFEVMLDSPDSQKKMQKASVSTAIQADAIPKESPLLDKTFDPNEREKVKSAKDVNQITRSASADLSSEDVGLYMNITDHFQVLKTQGGDVVFHF
jgi:hypothetical protein